VADVELTRMSLETRDPDRAAERMSALWSRVRLAPPDPQFAFAERALVTDELAVGRMLFGGRVTAQIEHPDVLVVGRVRSGRHSLTAGRSLIDTTQPLWLATPDRSHEVTQEDVDLEFFNIDFRLVEDLARDLVGDPAFRLHFTGTTPVSHAAVRHWILTARHVQHDLLGNAEAWANPLLRADGLRALAAATLELFPNNVEGASSALDRAEPPAVRRAKRFIEENLGRNISAQDIASAARVSLRGLQSAFRRHAGESPTSYLRRARLDAAHADLLAAAPGTSVEQVARRWGFAHLGRFAHDYREAFGRLPSATLRGESHEH